MQYKGKKILITQNALVNIAGSEMVTLELATFFKDAGAKVTVFTWVYSDPMKHEFEKRRIYVTTDDHDPKLKNPDIIWVHHQVLPLRIVDDLSKKITSHFIFLHMSYHPDIYLEQAYVYNLEKTLASKILFVSEESKNVVLNTSLNISKNDKRIAIFPNPVPKEYLVDKLRPPGTLQKILIVSNHPPSEIIQASEILKSKGYDVHPIGMQHSAQIVNSKLLKQYDLVIAIGKTVQYCLCLGTPIYVYDHFGGCGYLTPQNFPKAAFHNFSGRGFEKKLPEIIFQDIIDGYQSAAAYQRQNLKQFQERFSIQHVLNQIFNKKTTRSPHAVFNADYNTRITEIIARGQVTTSYINHDLSHENSVLKKQIDFFQTQTSTLETQLQTSQQLLANIQSSGGYNLALKLTTPLQAIRKIKHRLTLNKTQK